MSYKSHFRFGYDGKPFQFRSRPEQSWWVDYGRCEREPLSFRDECIETAKRIRESAKGDIWVLFSGGVDSEVALRAFTEAGIPVTAAIARFKDDINIHDIAWAVITCEQLRIPYRFFDLDLLDFWERSALEYSDRTQCVSPQLLTTMWLADQVPGYVVLGSGECLLVKDKPESYVPGVSPYEKTTWSLWEKEKIASWYRHFIVRGRDACPGFFQYTPEIMLSYLSDPFVQDLINDRIVGKLTTESSKLAIYQRHFDVATRPKYTGFEKVQDQDAVLRAQLKTRYPHSDALYKTECGHLIDRICPTGLSRPLEAAPA